MGGVSAVGGETIGVVDTTTVQSLVYSVGVTEEEETTGEGWCGSEFEGKVVAVTEHLNKKNRYKYSRLLWCLLHARVWRDKQINTSWNRTSVVVKKRETLESKRKLLRFVSVNEAVLFELYLFITVTATYLIL